MPLGNLGGTTGAEANERALSPDGTPATAGGLWMRRYDEPVSLRAVDFHVHLPTPDWLDGSMAGYVAAAEAYFRAPCNGNH